VGKTVDYRDRWGSHPDSLSSYGELTNNSSVLKSVALYIMADDDNIDFSYLVEQIFVCLLETYRSDLLVDEESTFRVDADSPIEHAEAIETALYFRKVSERVFQRTYFPGAINRNGFNVSFGANYSSPFKEWSMKSEQLLFLRHDTLVKSRIDGLTMPISIFRTARSKIAYYRTKQRASAGFEINCFQKSHNGSYFFGASHTQFIMDGTMGPEDGKSYYLVFEVRTDGLAHPNAWSRLPIVGPYYNWEQGRSLAVRIEWEHPAGSGKYRFRYMHTRKIFTFKDKTIRGSSINYIKSIGMTQWLMNAPPKHPQSFMERLRGHAYVLQTVYNYHTQTIELSVPQPIKMVDGRHLPKSAVEKQMRYLGLENVNGAFRCLGGSRVNCDTCAWMRTNEKKVLNGGCNRVTVANTTDTVCGVCLLFGRACCSWSILPGLKDAAYFTDTVVSGSAAKQAKISADDVASNARLMSILVAQLLPKQEQTGEEFSQQLMNVIDLSRVEDDLSDTEEEEDEVVPPDEGEDN
jgi:hypothetical protein